MLPSAVKVKALSVFLSLSLIISIPLHASRSRYKALGGEETAKYFFNDVRKVLVNPAAISENANKAIFEWGLASAPTTLAEVYSYQSSTPMPEGGVFYAKGNFTYGLYLGHRDSKADINRGMAFYMQGLNNGSEANVLPQDNPFEVIIGGDMGLLWGVSARYTHNSDTRNNVVASGISSNTNDLYPDRTQSALDIKFGFMAGALELFLDLNIFDKSKGSNFAQSKASYKGKFGVTSGLSYNYDDYVAFLQYGANGYEYHSQASGMLDGEGKEKDFKAGFGRYFRVSNNSKIVTSLYFNKYTRLDKNKISEIASENDTYEVRSWAIPVTITMESKLTDWLTIRGSLVQNLVGKTEHNITTSMAAGNLGIGTFTPSASTDVNAGATITLGKVSIDGNIGVSSATDSTIGIDNTNGDLEFLKWSRVALVYDF